MMLKMGQQFVKEKLRHGGAALAVNEGEVYQRRCQRGIQPLIQIMNSLAPFDDQHMLTRFAASKHIREMLLFFAEPRHDKIFSAELVTIQSQAFHALELLLAPPLDKTDASKMDLWHERLSLFDWEVLLPQMADTVCNLLDDKDIWKSASRSSPLSIVAMTDQVSNGLFVRF
jgi:hypothetical protein